MASKAQTLGLDDTVKYEVNLVPTVRTVSSKTQTIGLDDQVDYKYSQADDVLHQSKYVDYSVSASDQADSDRRSESSSHLAEYVEYEVAANDQSDSEVDSSGTGS